LGLGIHLFVKVYLDQKTAKCDLFGLPNQATTCTTSQR